jgi:hypothetical protein
MIGSVDQRLGYLERNQGRGLYPIYDDYARRGNIPDDAVYPDWFQPPPQGYDRDPTAHGIYTDYSSFHGYGQDIPFGGPPGGTFHANYFGGSSFGADGAGSSGGAGGSSRMDQDEDE